MWTFKRPVDDVWLFWWWLILGQQMALHIEFVILLELCHFCIHQKWINCKEYVNMSLYCWGISCSHPSDSPIFNQWPRFLGVVGLIQYDFWTTRTAGIGIFEFSRHLFWMTDHTTRPFFWCWCLFGRIHLVISHVGSLSFGRDEDFSSGPGRKDSYIRDWFPELWDTPWYRRWALCILCILRWCWEIAVETIGQSQLRL